MATKKAYETKGKPENMTQNTFIRMTQEGRYQVQCKNDCVLFIVSDIVSSVSIISKYRTSIYHISQYRTSKYRIFDILYTLSNFQYIGISNIHVPRFRIHRIGRVLQSIPLAPPVFFFADSERKLPCIKYRRPYRIRLVLPCFRYCIGLGSRSISSTTFTGGHSKWGQILLVKIAKYTGFRVYRRFYIVRSPVIL